MFQKPGSFAKSTENNEEISSSPMGIMEVELLSAVDNVELSQLPIHKHRQEILYALESNQVLILVGPSGTGKTTQVPQYLYDAGWSWSPGSIGSKQEEFIQDDSELTTKMIAITQPRRIAAISIANRVASERGCNVGGLVGYAVRFDVKLNYTNTRLLYMTDGYLLREAMIDPLLSKYSVIMLDEVHERTVNTDLLVMLLKKILKKRPSLRVIICSATLEASFFYDYFKKGEKSENLEVCFLQIENRQYDVEVYYIKETPTNLMEAARIAIYQLDKLATAGDDRNGGMLVFLPGREIIQKLHEWLEEDILEEKKKRLEKRSSSLRMDSILQVQTLYSGMSLEEQRRIFDPPLPGHRKVILSTNIAEASVTINGIAYVIDSGLVKLRLVDPMTVGMDTRLVTVRTSQSSANQRAGRAGRQTPGIVLRLYPKSIYDSMRRENPSELQYCDWIPILLQCCTLGIPSIQILDLPSKPNLAIVDRAKQFLVEGGALIETPGTENLTLTPVVGRLMAELPIHPRQTACLLASFALGCQEEMLSILALGNLPSFISDFSLYRSVAYKFSVEQGDHLTRYNILTSFQQAQQPAKFCAKHGLSFSNLSTALAIRKQLVQYCAKYKLSTWHNRSFTSVTSEGPLVDVMKALLVGYYDHLVQLNPSDGSYYPALMLSQSSQKDFSTSTNFEPYFIHPESVLFKRTPQYLLYETLLETTKPFLMHCSVIKDPQHCLLEMLPSRFTRSK